MPPAPKKYSSKMSRKARAEFIAMRSRILKPLEEKIKGLENEQAQLRQQLSGEQAKWAELQSVPNLERALARHGLTMLPPRPGQTVTLRGRFYEGWMAVAPRGNWSSAAVS